MKNKTSQLAQYLYPLLAGCSIFLAFERFNLFPTLFALPFLLDQMRKLSLRNKLLAYWLMAIVTNLGGFYWIRNVGVDYGGLPPILAIGLVLLYGIFNNLNFVLWAYLERFFGEKDNPFIIALFFAVAEQLNPQVFPWYLGTSLDSVPVFYQAADVAGVIGLSFITMVIIHIPWWLWKNRRTVWSERRNTLLAQIAFVAVLAVYGQACLSKYANVPSDDRKTVRLSLVQSNTSMEKFYGEHLNAQERLDEFQAILDVSSHALDAAGKPVDMVVWPEGAVHFPILNTRMIFDEIAKLAQEHDVYVTAGSGEIGDKRKDGRLEYFNTQFVLDRDGEIIGKYRKIMLLAFGEYIPFLDKFPFLEAWLPETISNFTRGTEKPIFPIDDNIHWLPLICYEDLMTDFIRGFDTPNADFFVNVTNDGWFGKSAASFLHMQQARVRCVEYRKPMARALNTGTSVFIDATGRAISKETELYVRDFINTTLYLPQKPPRSVYSRIGNLPVYAAIFAVALLWVRGLIKRRQTSG